MARAKPEAVHLVELRVLDGPNLYFTRPAIKVTFAAPALLSAPEGRMAALGARTKLAGAAPQLSASRVRPGPPETEHRRRYVARLAAHVTRTLAAATRTDLAVRARPGSEPNEIVVSFPWRRRGAAQALGHEVVSLLDHSFRERRSFDVLLRESAGRMARVEPGDAPSVPEPAIPVIAVTGTNGKTTTVRLLAHLGRAARMHVAFSSTDGVYFDGRLVEEGDYSGFGGAGKALSQPGVDLAVLETARGGILLRGIGTTHNDVAVVTNISADHLGLFGIRTLDQLAEVKSTITRITRPDGWDVLNADDPRVLAMRRGIRGRPWLFSLDHDHPALRTTLAEGGNAATIVDGWLTMIYPGGRTDPLVPLEEVPVTLAGISPHNVQNALAAASAALGAGLPRDAVVRGLRTFVLDAERNPGRTNLFEWRRRVVVVDYAHNEAGMAGLVTTCRGLRPPGAEIWIGFTSAGDRTNEILHGLGYLAARGADHVVIAELTHYLRGRDRQDLIARLRAGVEDGGGSDPPVMPDPLSALAWMLDASAPGDVVAVTALIQRQEIFDMLKDRGARKVGARRIRELVRRARAG